jgi:hypothetical protein
MHWLAGKIIDLLDALPNWFITEDSPHEMPVRMALFLILLTLVIYLIAMRPFRATLTDWIAKLASLWPKRKP